MNTEISKVNVLREWWSSRASAALSGGRSPKSKRLSRIETLSAGREELSLRDAKQSNRDTAQSALMSDIFDGAVKGES